MLVSTPVIFAFLLFCAWRTNAALAQTATPDQLIQFYQGRVARDPDDFFTYNNLGFAYIQKARETGDVSYYELAEKAFQKSLGLVSVQPAATTATTGLASVSFAQHQFTEALAYARQAVQLDVNNVSAHAVIGDAYLELGEYENAASAYEKIKAAGKTVVPEDRLAYLSFLRGDPEGAIQLMRHAVATATRRNAPRENLAWGQVQLGERLLAVGRADDACNAYMDALKTFPGYHAALAGVAKARVAQRQDQEAISLYREAIAVIPLPAYVTMLGDVYARSGTMDEAQKQYELVEYIGRLTALNQTLYNRELALFYADHDRKLPEALALAERELEVRQDIYTYDVLAWARYKNGKFQDALDAMKKALRLGTRDARLFFHAGMIYHAVGDEEKARRYLRDALLLNPYFHPLLAEVAQQTLSTLSD